MVRMVVGVTNAQTCLVLKNRLRALRLAGFEITLVSSPDEFLEQTAEDEGVAAHPIKMTRQIALLSDLLAFGKVLFLLLRVKPEIVDFSTPKAGLLGCVAAWLLRVPHRVYTLRGLKLESSEGRKHSLLLWAERVSAACAHVVLCNSRSLREAAIKLEIAPSEKLFLLGDGSSNGVDTVRFSPGSSDIRTYLKIPLGEPVLGFVGRLTRDKGIPELLIAFEEVLKTRGDSWLLLVGWFDMAEDALPARWRRKIQNHPRILHVGYVDDPAPYYRAMDVLVLPTHREGFPNVVLEGAASGLPTIATECTGARDAVISEVTGLLIPPGIPEAIAEAALELIQNLKKRKRMGLAARAWVLEHYRQDQVLGMATDFYRSLLKPVSQGNRQVAAVRVKE